MEQPTTATAGGIASPFTEQLRLSTARRTQFEQQRHFSSCTSRCWFSYCVYGCVTRASVSITKLSELTAYHPWMFCVDVDIDVLWLRQELRRKQSLLCCVRNLRNRTPVPPHSCVVPRKAGNLEMNVLRELAHSTHIRYTKHWRTALLSMNSVSNTCDLHSYNFRYRRCGACD